MAAPLPGATIEVKLATAEKSMDWLQWSSSLVHSLAWPVAAVIIAFIFRDQISGLLSKIRKLSWGDKVVDFAEKLDELEAATRVEIEGMPNLLAIRNRSASSFFGDLYTSLTHARP
jgi:hypothetical protein